MKLKQVRVVGNAAHLLTALLAAGFGYIGYPGGTVSMAVAFLFAYPGPDVDLIFRSKDWHRSWLTHSFLPIAFLYFINPEFVIAAGAGILAHLLVDLFEFLSDDKMTWPRGNSWKPFQPSVLGEDNGFSWWLFGMVSVLILWIPFI